MPTFLYVDNSNVWIEGQHVAAVASGLAPNIWTAQQARISARWSYDFGRLLEFASGGDIGRAVLYGSRPPPNDTIWQMAERAGFEVVVFDRNVRNKEKKIDTSIAVDIMADALTKMSSQSDEVALVAGDTDYVPVVERVRSHGFKVQVVFWDHAGRELKEAATAFTSLNPYLEHLSVR